MVHSGATFYFSYDEVGTLRAVFDAAGHAVKAVDYDSFGNVISDSNAGFAVPFGFAGGLYDADTKLTRFGFRDYDADVGRWTAKDPIGFAGGNTDLMGYCFSNPTNAYDVLGLTDAPTTTPTVPTAPGPTTVPPAGPTISTDGKTPSNSPYDIYRTPAYLCKRPLGGESDGNNLKTGPDVPGNPFYHAYLCARDPRSGNMVCGGQTLDESDPEASYWSGAGAPSDDKFNAGNCDEFANNLCVSQCVADEVKRPARPDYSIVNFPPSINCQMWAKAVRTACMIKCGRTP